MLPSRARFIRYAPAILAAATGLIVTAVLFAGVRKLERDAADHEFRQHADVRIASVKEKMLRAVVALKTLNHFFRASGTVDREQFQSFAAALLETTPYIRSFSFQRLLTQAERPAYEAAMRERHPNFSIGKWVDGKRVPVGPMDSYRVIDYLEPMQGNEIAFGLDASSIPKQLEAMQRARDTGLPSASDLLVLIHDREAQRSFIVLMPVYRRGAVPQDIGSRRRAVIGYTTAIVRTGTLVENALRYRNLLPDATISVSLYAGDSDAERALAFRIGSDPESEDTNSLWSGWLFGDRSRRLSQTFNVAGKAWQVAVSAQSAGFGLRHSGSAIILIAGLSATLAGAAYLQARSLRSSRKRQLVRRGSARIHAANELLSCAMGLRRQEQQTRKLRQCANESAHHAVILASANGPGHLIEQVDVTFERMTGYSSAEVVGRTGGFLWGDDHDQPAIGKIQAALDGVRAARLNLRMYRKDGTLFMCGMHIFPVKEASDDAAYFVVALYDLSAIARYRKELEFQANHDAPTGLANQYLLHDRLTQAIAYANRYADPLWIVAIDLEGGDTVNGPIGAEAGDMVLARMGERLQSLVRQTDTVARLGGGEFVLLLAARRDESLSPLVLRRLHDTVRLPLTVADRQVFPDCRVGVAIYPNDGDDSETLISSACAAMREARRVGEEIRFYSLEAAPALRAPQSSVT